MAEKLYIKDLAERLATQFDVSQKLANEEINFLIETIVKELKNGNSITLKQIGRFEVVEKPERMAHNPKTMEQVVVPARKAVSFTTSTTLKEAIK